MKKCVLALGLIIFPFLKIEANIDAVCENISNVEIESNSEVSRCFRNNGCERSELQSADGCDPAIAQQCCQTTFENDWSESCPDMAMPTGQGACEGEWGPWDTGTGTRIYTGVACRTISNANNCSTTVRQSDCEPCNFEEEDLTSPTCESVVDWTARPLESVVLSCEDGQSGCDEESYENGPMNATRTGVAPARACDNAGNCVDCPIRGVDETPPTCTATFHHPGRWHRTEEFEVNGGDLYCWIESCEDVDLDEDGGGHVASGCLAFGTHENTPKIYDDPEGFITQIQIQQDPLEPVHQDTCTIQVCDNAGNCSTCESPEVSYDGTNVCRASDQDCDSCAEDDLDCQCISGDRSKCRDAGPVNCYADPFHERCPAFDNEACLSNNFIPGCPTFNPCYPEANRDHPRLVVHPDCPADAIRFCSRNPYHYGCNEACKFGLIECDPDVPDGVE